MMTFSMLPFLLAIQTPLLEGHKNTQLPVYKYTAQISVYSLNPMTNLKTKAIDISSSLKCHSRGLGVLNCRIDNTEMRFHQQGVLGFDEEYMSAWDMSEEPFEVRFDERGLKELVFDRSMPPWVIGGLRAIMDQLNMGFDIYGRPVGVYVIEERSYLGDCQTIVSINRQFEDRKSDHRENDAYKILLWGARKEAGEILEIVKERNVKECSDDIDPLFGRKGATSTMYGSVPTIMVSSMSRIVISDSNYTAFTANDILAENVHTGETVQLFEEITLKLDSIAAGSHEPLSLHNSKLDYNFDSQNVQYILDKAAFARAEAA